MLLQGSIYKAFFKKTCALIYKKISKEPWFLLAAELAQDKKYEYMGSGGPTLRTHEIHP